MTSEQYSLLVVDDDEQALRTIVNYLQAQHYITYQAVTGDEALALYRQHKPDVILCDLNVPYQGEGKLQQHIQALAESTPVVVLSETNEVSDVVEALRFGASDYLFKPIVDVTILGHAVKRSLEYGQLQRENETYKQQLEQANLELKNSLALLEQDQKAGRQVQFKMLPASPYQLGEYHFSHRIFPSLYLSGDFVEYISVGKEHCVFFIADVSGHGASSAFVTVLLKNLFARKRSDLLHKQDQSILSPLSMLALANSVIFDTGVGKHLTMCVGVIHIPSGELRYSNAGHLPQPILSTDGSSQFLAGQGMPVGLFDEPEFSEQLINLPDKFVLTLFSDGILEILPRTGLRAQEAFLLERLQQPQLSVEALAESLELQQIVEFPDDIAVLLISKGYH
ncbi:fused response regulator/phosphatase [Dasania sp. GY-MA-18]|uniref:Fused response regulator/phosphatase n=1 Tax=Dasania phycosphaerae TaxID=2950436 RepID=A0A9J6RN82_9GAMM|nr:MULTISPECIES: fused response regulator/phosphatase [Dasania]MCR8923553.1 fused response regulator/phosphatase [Dasania sp. GY-MA-18]MCZ0865987.1 fused response regulator/phosphatase [Dasania phycosphaerae]MCZ0869711.1 fused response regulator/phosphatase [Dasania phycosphaerae]